MADVAILPPQNWLTPHHNHYHRRRHHHPNSNPKPTRRTRRSPPPRTAQARPDSQPVVGSIRILKRGEDAPILNPKPEIRLKPESVIPVDGFYAGFGFVTSPPPSSVPLPAFFTAERRNCGGAVTTEADIATGLRRLLNLQ